jgi:hypothetical protein
VLESEQVENFVFQRVFDVFICNLTVFSPFQKNLGQSVRKNNFLPKSNFSHAKVDMKAKKYTHFV